MLNSQNYNEQISKHKKTTTTRIKNKNEMIWATVVFFLVVEKLSKLIILTHMSVFQFNLKFFISFFLLAHCI